MNRGVSCRHSSDLALLWLWHRLAAAAPIQPLSLGTSICPGCGPKIEKKKKKERKSLTIPDLYDEAFVVYEKTDPLPLVSFTQLQKVSTRPHLILKLFNQGHLLYGRRGIWFLHVFYKPQYGLHTRTAGYSLGI